MTFPIDRGEFLPDPNSDGFLRLMRLTYWCFAPHGRWTEANGSYVVFDRRYHPICRVRTDGAVEIVKPDTSIEYIGEQFYHKDTPRYCDEARSIAAEIIVRLGIDAEIRRRLKIGRLPSANHRAATVKSGCDR